ncbi:MAG TPA: alpha/beta hydrolase [Devosia sp.]|nr:alpha/beta hydrolase [Devosia sp.]
MINRRHFLTIGAATMAAPLLFPLAAMAAERKTFSYGPARLDVYSPPSGRNLPVMIYVHGGAWQTGSRTHVRSKPAFFQRLNMVFVSIDYRLLPKADVATQADDVGRAIHWVKNNISSLRGNPARLSVIGHSAGAHLAALAIASGRAPRIAALIGNDTAAYDLNALARLTGGRLNGELADVFNDPSLWTALSPVSHIGSHRMPPSLIMWSNSRRRKAMGELFVRRLAQTGTPVQSFEASNLTHEQINKLIGTGRVPPLERKITRFLQDHL